MATVRTVMLVAVAVGISAAMAMPYGVYAQSKAVRPPRSAVINPPSAPVQKQINEQSSIYQSRGEQVPADYVTDRSLLSYASTLLPGFDHSLAELGPADRWLDIGAGQGRAILEYYGERYDAMHPEGREQRGSKASAVALSIEDRRTAEWQRVASGLEPGKIEYRFGKRLREYSADELGRFRLATDVYGGFSYTSNLASFMESVLGALEVNGSFYTILIDVNPERWPQRPAGPRAPYQTEIIDSSGSEIKVCTWLRSIRCVEVTCEADPRSSTAVERYRVKKICEPASVPALTTTHFVAGTPPARQFQQIEPVQ